MDQKTLATLLHLKQQTDIACEIPGWKLPLEPHQKVGVAFAILAKQSLNLDFLGSGKTVQAIATDTKLRDMLKVQRTLVICQGGKRWDWQNEYKRFCSTPTFVIDGTKQQRVNQWLEAQANAAVTISHYEGVRGDLLQTQTIEAGRKKHKVHSPTNLLKMLKFDFIIFDEVTIFKNYGTTLESSLEFLLEQTNPEYRLGLSATVIQKSISDLHCIYDKIRPGMLGTRREFEDKHVVFKQFSVWNGRRKQTLEKPIGAKNEEELAAQIAPFYIRREKDAVYSGKLKHVAKIQRVHMSPAQEKAYKEVTASVDRGEGRQSMLARFQQMEKICDSMRWFDSASDESPKIDDIMEKLDGDLANEKLVVFSKTHIPLRHLATRLMDKGIEYIYYAGLDEYGNSLEAKHRNELRLQFQNNQNVQVALVTAAAEMGFDFHAAHYMAFLNHIYNPARIDQLRGRIDRPIVQKSSFVCTLHYVTMGTFEENVIPRLHSEADLMRKVFGAANSFDAMKQELIEGLDNMQLYELIRTGRLRTVQDAFQTA